MHKIIKKITTKIINPLRTASYSHMYISEYTIRKLNYAVTDDVKSTL